MKYTIAAGDQIFEFSQEDVQKLDIVSTPAVDHLLIENQAHKAKLHTIDGDIVHLEVNGVEYSLRIQDKTDALVSKMGLNKIAGKHQSAVKAPMPGLILDIMVKEGDEVEEGQSLVVLEAMKMENVLKAAAAGVIKTVEVSKSQAVDKNQVLIEME